MISSTQKLKANIYEKIVVATRTATTFRDNEMHQAGVKKVWPNQFCIFFYLSLYLHSESYSFLSGSVMIQKLSFS